MNKTLTHSMKSYITIFLVGILVGCICRLTDYCPADTLWSFSSIQTLLGFWIITNTIIVLASTSNICAGISSFLYMFGMTLSFYGLQAILGTFIPLFSGGFRTSLFILFTICSIPCAIAAFILYYWNKEHIFNSILYSLPVGAVADGLFCREIDGLFCRSSPDIIVRRRCVLSHKRRGWLQPSPSFRYSRNLALQDELYHPVINNGPAVLVCVDKRLGTGPVNQSRDAG